MQKNLDKIKSHSFIYSDFDAPWYKNWAKKLKQTEKGRGKYHLHANKFWQNAVMVQALYERGALEKDNTCIGFGVGKERLPALFAGMGIKVTATDQDFTQANAKKWDNDQLAEGAFSLNEDGICKPDIFEQNVSYSAVDMTKISKKLNGKYDFLWSNCALGHLGSIDKSLEFVEKSLDCLKPGGWAVHTTEFNILSNTETVTSGSTVIFRAKDLYDLSVKLTNKGYYCLPFHFSPGNSKQDDRVILRPEWGNDYSKLQVGGHIASQIILIIHKPEARLSNLEQKNELDTHRQSYEDNMHTVKKMGEQNPTLKLLIKAQGAVPSDYNIEPVKKSYLATPEKKEFAIEYVNKSELPLMGEHEAIFGSKPIVLATHNPINHASPLATKNWHSPNRPSAVLYRRAKESWHPADYIKPGEKFGFVFDFGQPRNQADRSETFIVVQEGGDVIADTQVSVTIRTRKQLSNKLSKLFRIQSR